MEPVTRPARMSPRWSLLLVLVAAAVFAVGLCIRHNAPCVDDIRLQLAGSARAAHRITDGRTADFRTALTADFFPIGGYTIAAVLVFWLSGRTIAVRMRHRCLVGYGITGVLAAFVCAVAEKLLLLHGLAGAAWPFAVATVFATVKWLLLVLTLPIAAIAAGIILKRAALHALAGTGGDTGESRVIPPWPVMQSDGQLWPTATRYSAPRSRTARWDDGSRVPPGREQGGSGFCVSGGGIRSACFALGALQALRAQLGRARYLVSVSGGGYLTGALQLALTGPPDDGRGKKAGLDEGSYRITADEVYMPGTPEENHTRRHSMYVAEGTGQWLVALGAVLRGLLASLALLTASVLVLGLALSWGYHLVPLTQPVLPPGPLTFRAPALAAVALLLGLAAAWWFLWLVSLCLGVQRLSDVLQTVYRTLLVVGLLLAVLVIVIPGLAWGTIRLKQGFDVGAPQVGAGAGGTALFAYVTVLVSTMWRRVEKVKHLAGGPKHARLQRAVPNGITQYILVWTVLLVVTAAALLVLGWATATGRHWPESPVPWQIVLPAVLVTVALSLDQTWMSLHPFYRTRLVSAFAVRRWTTPGGAQIAIPYGFEEPTPLSRYGARRPGFPQVIFAAAASLSGDDRTPPHRHAVSFSLSYDYIGGPDVGYAPTDVLCRTTKPAVKPVIRKDLTVESAVAVSGAAFASAMGRQARAFQTLFALTNARLGTWLPNPGVLGALWAKNADWALPPLPAVRRLPYLLREVSGRYPMDDRMLLVTDGGHYDNLGLVELLRHGVTTAVCVDASGGTPPFAAALGEAITLAQEELGVEITFTPEEWVKLVPGGMSPLVPHSPPSQGPPAPPTFLTPPNPLASMNARLSPQAVIEGVITYPRELKDGNGRKLGTKGRLIVARSTLTGEMPYEILAYAQGSPVFPRDSTGDQWFDHRQFDAYRALGYWIGLRAEEKLRACGPDGPDGPGSPDGPGGGAPAPARKKAARRWCRRKRAAHGKGTTRVPHSGS
ncbi:hypothetical protein ACIHFE_19490 [Streptomyces sp. NPDC052396]|uniref:hypothetical protein n=1 Tax=Streptomyces sp. NPDC052396 TaxID=3365689 RepID=UPI0037CD5D97